uniref:Uncharacterized protein n=1 Tax=Bracon brevicornis TaxID=1563983 RepID=A0A6V7LXS6_9HYME
MEDNDNMNLIEKLHGVENWALWSFQAKIHLMSAEAYTVVTGEHEKPTEPVAETSQNAASQNAANMNAYITSLKKWEKLEA